MRVPRPARADVSARSVLGELPALPRKRGRPVLWTPRRVLKLRRYADRGFSMAEAAKLLDTTYGAVINAASRLGISFHGPPGAPKMNRNRKLGLWRQELRKIAAD